MKVSFLRLVVILFVLSMQQACVIPAAVDAMKRYTDYDVVATEQIDENNFYTLVSVVHSRGRFNPLGDHGGPTVITGMDYQLWHLQITDKTLSATLLDEIKLKSKDEIDKWDYIIENQPLDKINGRLPDLADFALDPSDTYPLNNLHVNSNQTRVRVYGLENNCSFELPPKTEWKWGRQLLSNEAGTHLMIVDEEAKGVHITVLDICDHKKTELNQSLENITAFSVYPDGNLKWIAGIPPEVGYKKYYEVILYPSQEKLMIDKDKLDLPNNLRGQQRFIFEESTKRFHWLIFHDLGRSPVIQLTTYDFQNASTLHRDAQLKPRRKK